MTSAPIDTLEGSAVTLQQVGFRPVGVLRRYERDRDGAGWHDGLLMDLLADDLD